MKGQGLLFSLLLCSQRLWGSPRVFPMGLFHQKYGNQSVLLTTRSNKFAMLSFCTRELVACTWLSIPSLFSPKPSFIVFSLTLNNVMFFAEYKDVCCRISHFKPFV